MLKWSLGSIGTPSTSSISTNYFSDSDASNITITSRSSRRRGSSRRSSIASSKNGSRHSGYASDFTNITDLSDFSEVEMSSCAYDDVFVKDKEDSILDMSPYLDSSFTLQNFEVCFSLKKALNEIRIWIEYVTKYYAPREDGILKWLKDGCVLRLFAARLSGHPQNRLKRLKPGKSNARNIYRFLKTCKKLGLHDDQLFELKDWNFITRSHRKTRAKQVEWVYRAKKVVSTISWLALVLKNHSKYAEKFIPPNFKFRYFKNIVDTNLCMKETISSSLSRLSHNNTLSPSTPSTSILYDSDASSRTKRKKVTFQENVQQHLCLVENKSKPYFNTHKDAPPKYQEFMEMKKSSSTELRSKGGGGSVPNISKPISDKITRRQLDSNNNNNTLPRSVKLNPAKEKIIPDLIILPSPKSPAPTTPDDGYLTGGQKGGTPYSPHSFITSQQESSNKNKFFKGSKRFTLSSQKSSRKNSKNSPSQIKKALKAVETSPKVSSKPPPVVEVPVELPKKETHTKQDDRNKMDTLTREEISDLNDLLSMFDEKDSPRGGAGSPVQQPPTNYFKSKTLERKSKLKTPAQKSEENIPVVEPISDTTEKPSKSNIPRTQSQNYGRRTEEQGEASVPRRPMGRSQTMTRAARGAYTKSLDRERAKKETKKTDDLDFLQDVVSELLAVGKVEEPVIDTKPNQRTKSDSIDYPTRIPRSVSSIDNFFDDIKLQTDSYSKSLDVEEDESTLSEGENDIFSTEGNDSGIEDETMPGITKESSHKRRSSSKHRKHHDDGEENRSSKRDKDRVKRSESDSKKSKKHRKHESDSKTNSLPRSDKHKTKSNGDVTVRIDGFDYNSDTIGRHGRPKERRSEPPLPTKPPVDQKVKHKSRKSEPTLSHHHKSRHQNDLNGGQIGHQERSMSDSHRHDRSKSPDKKDRSKSPSKNTTINVRSGDHRRPEGAENHRNHKSKEHTWDHPSNGRHHVYSQPKNEDPGPLPKKDKFRDFDNNIRSMVRGKDNDPDLVEKLGVTPDILKLLREEEKFWQRQQELKEWRQAKDSTYERPPPPSNYQSRSNYAPKAPVSSTNRSAERDAEILREAAENRLALQAEKLMKVRAEQEHILRQSRENLLDEPDIARPPPPRNYKSSARSSSSGHSHSQTTNTRSFPTTPTSPAREHAYPSYPQYANLPHTQPEPPPVNRTNKHSHHAVDERPKGAPSLGTAFSDDDDVFNETRKQATMDYRGYFSDDGFRDNTLSKTYLARPMFRQPNQTLRCAHCSNLIKENRVMFVDSQNYYWHQSCFRCVVCQALLNDSNAIRVRMVGSKLHCRFCTTARDEDHTLMSEV